MSVEASFQGSVAPPRAGGKRLRPAWLPTLAALFFAALTFWLGQWQLGRAEEKRALQAAFDAAAERPVAELAALTMPPPRYTRARVSGVLDGDHQIYLDNRVHQGRPGYHVIVPLAHADGVVLVNRGWLPRGGDRAAPPPVARESGVVTLQGLLVPARSRYLELSARSVEGSVWQNLDLDRFRAGYHAELPDLMLLQTSDSADGLARDWPRPDAGVERHLGYAGQWFSLTAAIAALYGYYGLWRRRRASR